MTRLNVLRQQLLLVGTAVVFAGGAIQAAQADDKATGKGLTIGWSQRGLSGSDGGRP